MERHRLDEPKRSWPVAHWTNRALHGTALKMNRLRGDHDLTARQEWLWTQIIRELEYRFVEDMQTFPWKACTCWLCFSPFTVGDAEDQGDDDGDSPHQSRPDGEPITRDRRQSSPEQHPYAEDPEH